MLEGLTESVKKASPSDERPGRNSAKIWRIRTKCEGRRAVRVKIAHSYPRCEFLRFEYFGRERAVDHGGIVEAVDCNNYCGRRDPAIIVPYGVLEGVSACVAIPELYIHRQARCFVDDTARSLVYSNAGTQVGSGIDRIKRETVAIGIAVVRSEVGERNGNGAVLNSRERIVFGFRWEIYRIDGYVE